MNSDISLLDRNECLLILVDIQKSMLNLCLEPERVAQTAALLIDFARIVGIPVLLTEQNPLKLGKFLPELTEKLPDQTVMSKVEFSCFENEAIRDKVYQSGRKIILLAGIETHVCIYQTGIQGIRYGYQIQVVADAVSSRTHINMEVGLRRLAQAGAVVTTAEIIIFEILKRAETLEFRNLLPLIKKI